MSETVVDFLQININGGDYGATPITITEGDVELLDGSYGVFDFFFGLTQDEEEAGERCSIVETAAIERIVAGERAGAFDVHGCAITWQVLQEHQLEGHYGESPRA